MTEPPAANPAWHAPHCNVSLAAWDSDDTYDVPCDCKPHVPPSDP